MNKRKQPFGLLPEQKALFGDFDDGSDKVKKKKYNMHMFFLKRFWFAQSQSQHLATNEKSSESWKGTCDNISKQTNFIFVLFFFLIKKTKLFFKQLTANNRRWYSSRFVYEREKSTKFNF